MKDNKFTVLCILGITWVGLFIAMLCGAKVNPRIEALVAFLCLGWFAYWTLSVVRGYFRKELDAPPVTPTPEPTQETSENAKSTNTPKS